MTGTEYLQEISRCSIDKTAVKKTEAVYRSIPDVVKQIVSFSKECVFLNSGIRMLSLSEILEADLDLHVPFAAARVIPVADCGENTFIVYVGKERVWAKFHIIDECMFKRKKSLGELIAGNSSVV